METKNIKSNIVVYEIMFPVKENGKAKVLL